MFGTLASSMPLFLRFAFPISTRSHPNLFSYTVRGPNNPPLLIALQNPCFSVIRDTRLRCFPPGAVKFTRCLSLKHSGFFSFGFVVTRVLLAHTATGPTRTLEPSRAQVSLTVVGRYYIMRVKRPIQDRKYPSIFDIDNSTDRVWTMDCIEGLIDVTNESKTFDFHRRAVNNIVR